MYVSIDLCKADSSTSYNTSRTRLCTPSGGYAGSWLFVLLVTAVSNFEMAAFGPTFQSKLLPEIAGCLVLSVLLLAQVGVNFFLYWFFK